MRIATFNLENLDDETGQDPSLATRVAIMRPQLDRIAADILCLQEVHSQDSPQGRTLAALDTLLAGTRYEAYERLTTKTTSGQLYQERNLVILSRFPLIEHPRQIIRDSSGPRPAYRVATAIPPDQTADPLEWERPILYALVDLGGERRLHVLNVHLKSKLATDIQGQKLDDYTWKTPAAWAEGYFISSMKRVGQALQVRLELDRLFDEPEQAGNPAPLIAVCGDFNAKSDEVPVQAICGQVEDTGNPAHGQRVMVACENQIAESARYSLFHLGRGEMIDHVLASRALLATLEHTEIHNEYLPDESGAFRTDVKFPESDHAPVVAQFSLLEG
jgi:endonuclease/exonuclease/phosphatase family metal-dependent hydrolase